MTMGADRLVVQGITSLKPVLNLDVVLPQVKEKLSSVLASDTADFTVKDEALTIEGAGVIRGQTQHQQGNLGPGNAHVVSLVGLATCTAGAATSMSFEKLGSFWEDSFHIFVMMLPNMRIVTLRTSMKHAAKHTLVGKELQDVRAFQQLIPLAVLH